MIVACPCQQNLSGEQQGCKISIVNHLTFCYPLAHLTSCQSLTEWDPLWFSSSSFVLTFVVDTHWSEYDPAVCPLQY